MKIKLSSLLLLTLLLTVGCNTQPDSVGANNIIEEPTTSVKSTISEITETTETNSEEENLISEQSTEIEESIEDYITEKEIVIRMVGDNLIHSPLYKAALQDDNTYNFDMLFEHMKDDIESADLAIINQETIFTADRNQISSYPMFGSPTEVGDAIVKAGFNIVAHATNHTFDKNTQGILDTINFWETKYPNITYLGIHDDKDDSDVEYIEVNGIKIALVNYTYGLNGLESWRIGNEYMVDMLTDDNIEETLQDTKRNAELTIAILHVGNEYVYEPTEYAKEQVYRFIDNGADIVLCAHPHVIEPFEMVTTDSGKTGLVYYSLGNYVSNQNELPRILGGMAEIRVRKTMEFCEVAIDIIDYDMIPLVTHQEIGYFTTYKLEDYTDELAAKHKLKSKGLSVEYLNELYNKIVNN